MDSGRAPTSAAAPRRLQTGRADATLLTAPAYFKARGSRLQDAGESGRPRDIYASTVYLFSRKDARRRIPKLAEAIIKAHAEAIKRFYDDKAFAVEGLHRVTTSRSGGRRRPHLRPLARTATSSNACRTCSRRPSSRLSRSRPIRRSRRDEGVRLPQGRRQQHRRPSGEGRLLRDSCSARRSRPRRSARRSLRSKLAQSRT